MNFYCFNKTINLSQIIEFGHTIIIYNRIINIIYYHIIYIINILIIWYNNITLTWHSILQNPFTSQRRKTKNSTNENNVKL